MVVHETASINERRSKVAQASEQGSEGPEAIAANNKVPSKKGI